MNQSTVIDQLKKVVTRDDFMELTEGLTEEWSNESNSFEAVEPILRFMESHPEVDYGMPGPLVHFVERFNRSGYEEKLIESLERHPIAHTVWMLNRVINGTKGPQERRRLISKLEMVRQHPATDGPTFDLVNQFLARLSAKPM